MKVLRTIILAVSLWSSLAYAQERKAAGIKWNGFYTGFQAVNLFNEPISKTGLGVYGIVIVGIGNRYNVQAQIIVPLGERGVVWRLAVDRRIF